MASHTPRMKDGILELPGREGYQPIFAGSAEWYQWLEANDIFAFEAKCGSFTAHRRRRAKGYYWYAYRRQKGRLATFYLGKTEELTPQRLEDVARAIEMPAQQSPEFGIFPGEPASHLPPLATKFCLPQHRLVLVPRPRLKSQLDGALVDSSCKLVLISAPAGYGKTTLLSEWAHHCAWSGAWISLDGGDKDLTTFLTSLATALSSLDRDIGSNALSMLHSPWSTPETVLAMLVNSLAGIRQQQYLILDDYHYIESLEAQPVHDAVLFLIEHLPPSVRLILASRNDPPMPVARLRAQGQLVELRAADLGFTALEAEVFLNRVMGLALQAEEVEKLSTQAEGWIVGLQLAALSLQGRDSEVVPSVLRDFSGSQRHVLDYLAEEVLRQQPESVQSFLRQTSILGRLGAPLCAAVTGQSGCQEMLERLERANLFILSLDEQRHWYRYHHLFAEFLRSRLSQAEGEPVAELHRRAAKWYEDQGLPGEAIGHALAAEDFDWAADLIEQISQAELARGNVARLQGWLRALPRELVQRRPNLGLLQAWALAIHGKLEAAEALLDGAEAGLGADLAEEKRSEIAALRALTAVQRFDLVRLKELADQGFEALPKNNLFLRSIGSLVQAFAHDLTGDTGSAMRAYLASRAFARAAGSNLAVLLAASQIGDTLYSQGHLRQAAETYRQAIELTPADREVSPWTGLVYAGLGTVEYEWNRLAEAERNLMEAVELGQRFGNDLILIPAYTALARLKQAMGDPEGALKTFEQIEGLPVANEADFLRIYVRAARARIWLMQGNLPAAQRWLQEDYSSANQGEDRSQMAIMLSEIEKVVAAQVLLAEGKIEGALSLLASVTKTAESAERRLLLLEALALQALALQAKGDAGGALDYLERALELAEPEGIIRTFVEKGNGLVDLLSALRLKLQQGSLADSKVSLVYVDTLLRSFEPSSQPAWPPRPGQTHRSDPAAPPTLVFQDTSPAAGVPSQPSVIETMSKREREVLRLAATGASNQEIAEALTIEVSTVKTHLVHLYGKLSVRNRAQAAARARELGLLA